MRKISLLVVHCSATPPTMDVGADTIRRWHQEAGYRTIGYHYVIRRSGLVEAGRPVEQVGAHVRGHNANSIGVCLVGGIDATGKPESNFTAAQFASLRGLLDGLRKRFPGARICGHRDLSPDKNGDGKIDSRDWVKACPSFDVGVWLAANL
jgi:N-acetylmuramoyl-L-alanine amidase